VGGGNGVEILSYHISECKLDGGNGEFDEDVYTQVFEDSINPTADPVPTILPVTQAGKTNLAEFTLAKWSAEELNLLNKFDVNCTLSIYQKLGNYVYSEPETEYLVMHFSVNGSALSGTPEDEILNKINDRRHGIIEDTKFISQTQSVIDKLEGICNIGAQIARIRCCNGGR
jgi:predicted 3-demethylubiquinone-9 3-methyltransferase (glyoxalase superfamily)